MPALCRLVGERVELERRCELESTTVAAPERCGWMPRSTTGRRHSEFAVHGSAVRVKTPPDPRTGEPDLILEPIGWIHAMLFGCRSGGES